CGDQPSETRRAVTEFAQDPPSRCEGGGRHHAASATFLQRSWSRLTCALLAHVHRVYFVLVGRRVAGHLETVATACSQSRDTRRRLYVLRMKFSVFVVPASGQLDRRPVVAGRGDEPISAHRSPPVR